MLAVCFPYAAIIYLLMTGDSWFSCLTFALQPFTTFEHPRAARVPRPNDLLPPKRQKRRPTTEMEIMARLRRSHLPRSFIPGDIIHRRGPLALLSSRMTQISHDISR